MTLIHNEFLFFLQIIIIGIFLLLFGEKKYTSLLSSLFIHLFIFLNLLSANEIIIFSIHSNAVEPFGILIYFISVLLYSWDKKAIDQLLKNIYIINTFLCIIFLIIINYQYFDNFLIINILKQYIYNTFISIISLNLSYYIEQYFFNRISSIKYPIRETAAVSIAQLFDTIFYTILIFFNRSYNVILEIIFCSYAIKLFCILCYGIFLYYQKKN
jgi:hypothetical protein